MFSILRYSVFIVSFFGVWFALWGCDGEKAEQKPASNQSSPSWNRQEAELEYKLIRTELELARSERLYLVLDLKRSQVELKLKAAVVWNCPMEMVQPDSQISYEFSARFMGDYKRLMLPLGDKHLFAGEDKTPDSVLTIVGEVANVDPELMQRDLPARFQLLWDGGLTVEVHTQVKGKPRSVAKGALVSLRHALRSPFGETQLVLFMNPEDALTLYRTAQPGMPTLLRPPNSP